MTLRATLSADSDPEMDPEYVVEGHPSLTIQHSFDPRSCCGGYVVLQQIGDRFLVHPSRRTLSSALALCAEILNTDRS